MDDTRFDMDAVAGVDVTALVANLEAFKKDYEQATVNVRLARDRLHVEEENLKRLEEKKVLIRKTLFDEVGGFKKLETPVAGNVPSAILSILPKLTMDDKKVSETDKHALSNVDKKTPEDLRRSFRKGKASSNQSASDRTVFEEEAISPKKRAKTDHDVASVRRSVQSVDAKSLSTVPYSIAAHEAKDRGPEKSELAKPASLSVPTQNKSSSKSASTTSESKGKGLSRDGHKFETRKKVMERIIREKRAKIQEIFLNHKRREAANILQCPIKQNRVVLSQDFKEKHGITGGVFNFKPEGPQRFRVHVSGTVLSGTKLKLDASAVTFNDPRDAAEVAEKVKKLLDDFIGNVDS